MEQKKTKVIEVRGNKYEVPKGFSLKQLELLTLVFPAPLGYGLRIKDAATVLRVTPQAARAMLARIKKRFPEIAERYKLCLKVRTRQIKNARNIKNLGWGYRDNETGDWNGDMLTWLDEESNSICPSESAKQFGLIREVWM